MKNHDRRNRLPKKREGEDKKLPGPDISALLAPKKIH